MDQYPTVISQEELVPKNFKTKHLQIISLNGPEPDTSAIFLPTIKVIPQDENYHDYNKTILQEYFGECSVDSIDCEIHNSIHEYFGETDSEDHNDSEKTLNFTDCSEDFSEQDDDDDVIQSQSDWGICISCDQKECCICFETKLVFTPSCCGEKQDICLDCIWNIIKQKIPKRQQLDNKIIEKYLLSEFTCCFCREKTKINIHIPSMFPCLFSNFCKSILDIQKPKKKRGRPKKNTTRRGRPRRQ